MSSPDESENRVRPSRPPARARRWTSFVAAESEHGEAVRALHEQQNPSHRLRVEHDAHTLLIHLSDESGRGWTTIAVDRQTRSWAVAQGATQGATAREAHDDLYGS